MKKLMAIVLAGVFMASCSSVKKEIEHDKAALKDVHGKEDMLKKMAQTLDSSEKLTPKQKREFLALHTNTRAQVASINEESAKLKVILFNHLLEEDYDTIKVRELQRRLKKLHNKKFDVMINSLTDARKILGVEFKEVYPEHYFYEGATSIY